MLPPRQKHSSDRMHELIAAGNEVAKLEVESQYVGPYIKDKAALQSWLSKVTNIIEATFGAASSQSRHLSQLMPHGPGSVEHSYEVLSIVGLLSGAVNDLERGYLLGQEFLIAGELFDSLLEQAAHLNRAGYKDPSAVLGRVVLEDSLLRIARREGLDTTQKPSVINDALKNAGIYAQPQWRIIQAWLDIGNAAAHGKFGDFSQEDVTKMLDGIASFLAREFRA